MGAVTALVTAALPATAIAAPRGPEATVKAYVAAYEQRHGAAACALLDPSLKAEGACGKRLASEARFTTIARARVGAAFTRGARARVVVDLVYAKTLETQRPSAARDRVLLRRAGGRWRIVATSTLPGGRYAPGDPPDPAPTARAAALRRLADDELLAVSGTGSLLCGLLAPGAPLSGPLGGCRRLNFASSSLPGGLSARIERYAAHVTGAGRARLELTVAATRAVRSSRPPGYTLRTRRWTDTVFAVRSGGRWRLVKPSRSVYLGFLVPEPADVATPAATATWPAAAVPRPSASERPTPAACATPPAVWGLVCDTFDGAAFAARPGGGGLLAWTAGFSTFVRPVAGGTATAPISRLADLPAVSSHDDPLWVVQGLAPVADGALVLEGDVGTGAAVAVPVDADGRPRGAPQTLSRGSGDPEDTTAPVAVAAPPGAPATVLVDDAVVLRLGADGRPVAPEVTLRTGAADASLVATADGGLLQVGGVSDRGVSVGAVGADGRLSGPQVVQPTSGARMEIDEGTVTAAVDAAGRVLIAWAEEDGRGTAVVRAWRFDPATPTATAPATVSTFPVGSRGDATFDPFDSGRAAMALGALPGGGWGLAWVHAHGARDGLWSARLSPDGAPLRPPARAGAIPGQSQYGFSHGFGIAGDAVAWIEPPPRVGLAQIQAVALS